MALRSGIFNPGPVAGNAFLLPLVSFKSVSEEVPMSPLWQIVLAALIGLLIGTGLGLLLWQGWMRRQRQQLQRQRQGQVIDSLEVLCLAVEQQQVELSEAAIRLSALLDTLPASIEPKVDVAVIHQFAETCQRFDRGEQRQRLTPRARHQQDSQRRQLEQDQQVVLQAATQRLVTVLPSWRSGLGLAASLVRPASR